MKKTTKMEREMVNTSPITTTDRKSWKETSMMERETGNGKGITKMDR